MKKIKKLLTIGLTFLLCFTAFTACNLYKENLWFSEEKLQKCLVSDLPKLNSDKYVRYNDNDVYAKLTEEEFHSYANEIYEYLLESNFVYLGTRGETLHGAFSVYYFEPASELSEFKDGGDYRFVYSDGKIKNGNGELTFCIIMIDYFYPNDFYYPNQANGSTRTIKYDKNKEFEYNAIISLRFNSEAPLGGRYELHEHTCKLVGNEAGHQTVYTCGCPSPDIMELHNDNNGDYICDVCGWPMDGILPEIVPDKIEGIVQLRDILQTLPFEYNVERLIKKYHFDTDQGFGYYLVDNSEDYCEFLSDIGVPYEGPFDELFEEKVMFCYLRCVSGSAEFIPVEYFYNAEINEIESKTVYQPDEGSDPAVVICWCVDLVEVPRDIFEQLNKE